jgi:uncharacterized protein YggU (UPF0235/DUF167 family)
LKGSKGFTIEVRVHTGSSRREVVIKGRELHVYTPKKPVKGEANLDVVGIISEYYRVPKSSIELLRGERAKVKLFRIAADLCFDKRQE